MDDIREGEPNKSYTWNHPTWGPVTLRADAKGNVPVTSVAERLIADLLGLQPKKTAPKRKPPAQT